MGMIVITLRVLTLCYYLMRSLGIIWRSYTGMKMLIAQDGSSMLGKVVGSMLLNK